VGVSTAENAQFAKTRLLAPGFWLLAPSFTRKAL
jgi:hypothetical protein